MILILFISIIIIVIGWSFIYKRKIQIWLLSDIKQKISKTFKKKITIRPVHILFCFVDHFEPGWNKADLNLQRERVNGWIENYPKFAKKFKDSDGVHPRHTWFYPPHYFKEEHIVKLLSLCKQGYGEIEMHLHHSRMEPFPDTSQTLKQKIVQCVDIYSRYGIFKTAVNGTPQKRYAFIHGDWALDNSRPEYCGINDEITILKETGCYADFTFPSYMVESQPRIINSIYYTTDDPDRPKSYNFGDPVEVGVNFPGDLMMIQGPLGFRWKGRKRLLLPNIDDGEISANNLPSKERVDFWISRGIHVKGKPDWVIVKVFTHGAAVREHDALLGDSIRSMHAYLTTHYNDGSNYLLHYVSARELYNIIKAAEAGLNENPQKYRDFVIDKYDYLK